MPEIRVVMAMAPPLLADMLGELLTVERDIALVAEVTTEADLLPALRRTLADVVVMAADSPALPSECQNLFSEFPQLRVVTVEKGGIRGSVRQDGHLPVVLAELSPAELLAAIRRK